MNPRPPGRRDRLCSNTPFQAVPEHHAPTLKTRRKITHPAAKLALGIALVLGTPLAAYAQDLAPTAFTTCPSKAFLTQGTVPKTYGVNLVTGDYQVIANHHGTTSSLNGVGFNENDGFIYGWSYEYKQPARVHNDWQIEPLMGVNITPQNFYVGDVDTVTNKYYVYRRGATYGLYSIGLDPNVSDYLQMQRVVDGQTLSLFIADMAFHPTDGYAYAVESDGDLHQVSVFDGSSILLGNIGHTGGYGAAYFDPNGNLYVGRNSDGHVFRIAIDSGNYAGELFAIGPAASTNDGSRCASAPLVDADDTGIDFGDAPDSYGTTLDSNGARHGLVSNPGLYLGSSVDGESDSSFYPLSDDDDQTVNDEDGVFFVTNLVERENATIVVNASDSGNVSAWIDINRDGKFDEMDQVMADYPVDAGDNYINITIPDGVSAGDSWARVRLSTSEGLEATGGVSDGEVEDYQVSLMKNPTTITSYPSASGWTTIAYEDNWPLEGDNDMNDLVVYLRTKTYETPQGVTQVDIYGQIAAVGASYHNGFAIRLPGVLRSQIDEDAIEFSVSGHDVSDQSPLEAGRNEAILIATGNTFDYIDGGELCEFYRTEDGCGSIIQMQFKMTVPFTEAVDVDLSGAYDPFLFASEGAWHGAHFSSPPGRSYEIHLKNQAPTEAFNMALFANTGQDASSPDDGLYFLNSTGMPWAMEITDRWYYPLEYVEISAAYPKFAEFASSNGTQQLDWYDLDNSIENLVFKD